MEKNKFNSYVEHYINKVPPYMSYLKHIYDANLFKILSNIKTPIKIGTDCSGIDAPIHALKLLNIPFVYEFASDIDRNSIASIMANTPPKKMYTDISKRQHDKLPHIDMYFAGFPCQSFSTLGKRQGFDDKKMRGTIFFHCYETIKQTKPTYFILENVKGLTNHDNGNTFQQILYFLKKMPGYKIYYDIYNTSDYGIPQSRDRIYIIGIKSSCKFMHPTKIPLKISINDILQKNVRDNYYYEITPHKIDLLNDLVNNGVIDSLKNNWIVNLNVSTYKRTGAKKNISPCLLAGEGGNCTFYLTSKKRRLTEIEYLRLQGFPPDFTIVTSRSNVYKQAGNAMSVNVLCFIIKQLFMCSYGYK